MTSPHACTMRGAISTSGPSSVSLWNTVSSCPSSKTKVGGRLAFRLATNAAVLAALVLSPVSSRSTRLHGQLSGHQEEIREELGGVTDQLRTPEERVEGGGLRQTPFICPPSSGASPSQPSQHLESGRSAPPVEPHTALSTAPSKTPMERKSAGLATVTRRLSQPLSGKTRLRCSRPQRLSPVNAGRSPPQPCRGQLGRLERGGQPAFTKLLGCHWPLHSGFRAQAVLLHK